ncbi:hypothetical protein ACIGXM_36050 [Kitasatospora sp. NPDC052896]|uniref:hypothetical protein n=1 Tax=Kitasatospora sp. NPDC052896 TaxID=3364061 RepID=UPI0037C8E151
MSQMCDASVASLSGAAGGMRFPTWRTTKAYVEACGGEIEEWRRRWEEASRDIRYKNNHAAIPLDDLTAETRRRASWGKTWKRWQRTGSMTPPHRASSSLDLRLSMESLRQYRSLSLREVARGSRYSHSAIAAAISGARPVNVLLLVSYLQACGVDNFADVTKWLQLLAMAHPGEVPKVEREIGRLEILSLGHSGWDREGLKNGANRRIREAQTLKKSDALRSWILRKPPKEKNNIILAIVRETQVSLHQINGLLYDERPLPDRLAVQIMKAFKLNEF